MPSLPPSSRPHAPPPPPPLSLERESFAYMFQINTDNRIQSTESSQTRSKVGLGQNGSPPCPQPSRRNPGFNNRFRSPPEIFKSNPGSAKPRPSPKAMPTLTQIYLRLIQLSYLFLRKFGFANLVSESAAGALVRKIKIVFVNADRCVLRNEERPHFSRRFIFFYWFVGDAKNGFCDDVLDAINMKVKIVITTPLHCEKMWPNPLFESFSSTGSGAPTSSASELPGVRPWTGYRMHTWTTTHTRTGSHSQQTVFTHICDHFTTLRLGRSNL